MARGKKKESALTPEEKLAQALVPDWEWPYKVPENWCWVKLERLCSIPITDGTHKTPTYSDRENGSPFVSAKDITSEYIDWTNIKYITKELHTELYERLAPQKNDVLLAKNGTTGVAALVEDDRVFDLYVTIAVLRPNMGIIIPQYLLRVINSPVSKNQFDEHLTGIGVPNLHLRDIKATAIPLPPFSEQQRIVDRIEYLFAKLDEAKEKAQSVLDSFETRKAAILHKAFTGELTAKWRVEHGVHFAPNNYSLIEVFNFIDYRGMTPDKTDSGIPLITAKNIKKGYIDYRISEYISPETYLQRLGRGIARRNDLLITTEAPLGNVALADQDTYSTAQRVIVLQLREEYRDKVNNKYVMHYMLDESFQTKLQDQKTGSTVAGIKAAKLKLIPIVLPCVDEQLEVVRILDSLFAKEQQAKEAAEAVLEKIDLLKKSILARAFRGELGTNDPTEESALELLKQVLQEDTPTVTRKRSKSIPKDLKAKLNTELERRIIKLYFKTESDTLPVDDLLSVSSKKFEIMNTLRLLVQRKILTKLPNGKYRLLE